jgi:cytosine/adenosine deaminase-related metal-dependent hydrolase
VEVDDAGEVLAVLDPSLPETPAPASAPERVDGILIPGLINAHCHLELSHLRGKSATGKTLLPFLVDVVTMRDVPPEEIRAAIEKQDRGMWERGVQAVGDICNTLDTAAVKRRSPIRYYSFVEMFDFLQPERAAETFERYAPVYAGQPGPKSAVPHAPYTVSDPLYERINRLNTGNETVSIHNQETGAEDELFLTGKGDFPAFFAGFGATLDHFSAPGTPSIYHALERMDPRKRTLFVHNTLTTEAAIRAAEDWGKNGIYWATCPNANLYIENRLPRYERFLRTNAKVCIGTDSLTSNWQLDVLEEMKTIARYQSFIPFADLLRWATLNGAEALQMDGELGSLEVGKSPGLLALSGLEGGGPEDHRLGPGSGIRRLV